MMPHDKAGLAIINTLENNTEDCFLLTEFTQSPIKCQFRKKENGNYLLSFILDIDHPDRGLDPEHFFTKHCFIKGNGYMIVVYNFNIVSFNLQIDTNKPQKYKIEVREFRGDVNENNWKNSKQGAYVKYDRKIFEPHRLGLIFDMEGGEKGLLPTKGIYVNIGKLNILFYYEHLDNDTGYFFFLAKDPVDFEPFKKAVESMMVACGLISGYYMEDSIFFVSAKYGEQKNISFRYENAKRSIINNYPIIPTGFFSELSEEEYNLSSQHFNNLVQLIYKNEEYLRSALLLINAGRLNGCAKASMGSVALETISNVIAKDIKERNVSKNEKDVNSKVKYELTKTLKSLSDKIDKKRYELFTQRINQITNVPNATKLEDAFPKIGIELTKEEKYCLKCRNLFLHGSLPKNKDYAILSEIELLDLVAHRVVMLSAMLLLKMATYDKKVIDWGKTELVKKREIMNGIKTKPGQCLRNISQIDHAE